MIAYEILVQTIADWKAGARPSAPTLPPIPSGAPPIPRGAPEAVEEYSSGVVDLDDEPAYEAEAYDDDEAEAYDDGEPEAPAAAYDDDEDEEDPAAF